MTLPMALVNLKANGLQDIVSVRGQEAYETRNASYWSLTAKLRPWAIVQPRNTLEVSATIKALVSTTGCQFAIRSGGHTPWAGASNINDGVTIDLGLMAGTTYDPSTQIASLLPGGTWADVYTELEKHGRMVAGGREGQVGVGGLLLGGGKTFYTCRVGFACDQVVNYEVVLADGTIINANDQSHPDLFRVLKGGGNNFGIVTRFDMVTFPAHDIWDGTVMCGKDATPQVAEVFLDFVENLSSTADSHVLAIWTYLPQTEEYFINMAITVLDGQEDTESLRRFTDLPGQKNMKITTVATKINSFSAPSGKEDAWFSLTFKADIRIIMKAAAVFEDRVKQMKSRIPDHNFQFAMVLQPLPKSFGQHSDRHGGNMLGLNRIKDDAVLLVWGLDVETPDIRAEIGYPILKSSVDEIGAFAKSVGGDIGFLYLNYCDGSQNPFASYGGENVEKMRVAAAKYDPMGVFQSRVPGGFKISNVM